MDMVGLTVTHVLMDDYLANVDGLVMPGWMDNGIHTIGECESAVRAVRMLKALIAHHYDDPAALADYEAREAVITSVLDVLVPIVGGTDGATDYGWSSRYEIVRRTREYILDRIEEPLQISEICRDLGVSAGRCNIVSRMCWASTPSPSCECCASTARATTWSGWARQCR